MSRSRRISLEPDKINYSTSERELFRFLPKNGSRISSLKLTELKKKAIDGAWNVEYPQKIITVTMQNLIEKVKINREAFVIRRTPRCGPHPIQYWIEMKR